MLKRLREWLRPSPTLRFLRRLNTEVAKEFPECRLPDETIRMLVRFNEARHRVADQAEVDSWLVGLMFLRLDGAWQRRILERLEHEVADQERPDSPSVRPTP